MSLAEQMVSDPNYTKSLLAVIVVAWLSAMVLVHANQTKITGKGETRVSYVLGIDKVEFVLDIRPRYTIKESEIDTYISSLFVHFGVDSGSDPVIVAVRMKWGG